MRTLTVRVLGMLAVCAAGAAIGFSQATTSGQAPAGPAKAVAPLGRNFDLYLINVDGSGLERVTYNDTFDGFPMFSPDGRQLVFASNRHDAKAGETNVFIADWK